MVSRADQTFSEIRYLGSRAGVRTGNVCRKNIPATGVRFPPGGAVLGEPHLVQRYSVGTLMLPKNRDQKGIVPGYQGQCPDRRFHFPVAMGHVGVLFGRLAQCTTQWDFNREACKWQARRGGRYRPDGWPPASRHAVAPWSPGRAPRTVRSGRRFAEQSGLSLVCHLMGSDEASSKGCNGFCLANGLLRKKAAALLAWLPFSDPAQPGGCAKFLAVWIAPIAAAYEARGSSPRNFFVRTPNIALRPAPLVSRS